MNSFTKGTAIVLGPDDGKSFWQPLPSRGYVVNKFSPYTSPYDNFSIGIQVLEPGARVRRRRPRTQSRNSVLLSRHRDG